MRQGELTCVKVRLQAAEDVCARSRPEPGTLVNRVLHVHQVDLNFNTVISDHKIVRASNTESPFP